jgi:PKHD-type hydroxylase
MKLENYFWFFKGGVSSKVCDDIIKTGLSHKPRRGTTGMEARKLTFKKKLSNKDIKELKHIRNSKVVFLNQAWVYNIIHTFVQKANVNAGWNFQLDFTEYVQFTLYSKKNHYTWHNDSHQTPYAHNHKFENYRNKIRKLSCIIQLSDPSKFTGGELEFDFRDSNNGKPVIATCPDFNNVRGSVIIFPGFVYHRVKPIKKGTRYSLVSWSLGNPYV